LKENRLSTPTTIFDSDTHEAVEEGYQVQLAHDDAGAIVAVAIIDMELGHLVELPAEVALLIAQAIKDKVRQPSASLH
jgi:hypothetical protein